jgi:hypothetical protein
MEVRVRYTREQFKQGRLSFVHMPGKDIPANKIITLVTRKEHKKFRHGILGLGLLLDSELMQVRSDKAQSPSSDVL